MLLFSFTVQSTETRAKRKEIKYKGRHFHLLFSALPFSFNSQGTSVQYHVITILKGNYRTFLKKASRGFPGGAVVENLPANAGDTGSSPGLGRSHVPRSNWVREPQLLSLRIWSLCSASREVVIVKGPCTAMKSGPRLPQLEKALAQKQRPNTAINK